LVWAAATRSSACFVRFASFIISSDAAMRCSPAGMATIVHPGGGLQVEAG
jgi:hypothetical protein